MIFSARNVSTFTLFSLLSFSSFAVDKTAPQPPLKQAYDCVDWIVNGSPFANAAQRINALDAALDEEQIYPLPYVLANLGLAKWTPEIWSKATKLYSRPHLIYSAGISADGAVADTQQSFAAPGTPLLSLGEGRSAFIPFAAANGLKAYGLDPANDYEKGKADRYLGKNWMVSLSGDARDMSGLPDQSQQMVVSHMLLTQLEREDRVAVLRESFRVLQARGTARHSILIPNIGEALGGNWTRVRNYEALIVDAVKSLVREALGDTGYQVAVFLDEPQLQVRNSDATPIGALIDTDVHPVGSMSELRQQLKPLAKPALNLLVVLRRPDNSWFSSEWLFGP